MAIIEVHNDLISDDIELFEVLVDAFDSIKEVSRDDYFNTTTFRVENDEIPKDNTQISPELIRLAEGIKPIVIDWGL